MLFLVEHEALKTVLELFGKRVFPYTKVCSVSWGEPHVEAREGCRHEREIPALTIARKIEMHEAKLKGLSPGAKHSLQFSPTRVKVPIERELSNWGDRGLGL